MIESELISNVLIVILSRYRKRPTRQQRTLTGTRKESSEPTRVKAR